MRDNMDYHRDVRPGRERCQVAHCSEPSAMRGAGVCKGHWKRLPEDLQVRWRDVAKGDDEYDREAARRAIADHFAEGEQVAHDESHIAG